MGTPQSLDEALAIILGSTNVADLREYPYAVIKDFLAQRFGAVMLKESDHPYVVRVLEELFAEITKRPHKEKAK